VIGTLKPIMAAIAPKKSVLRNDSAHAISGGTELLVFVTTFAVQGGTGKAVIFPAYWGNNFQKGNVDFCAKDPGLG